MELLFENEYIQIRLIKKIKCIEYQWKKCPLNEHFIDLMEKVYRYINEHNCTKLIPDLRNQDRLSEDIRNWAMSDWFPRLVRKGVRTYAIVNPNSDLTRRINEKNPRIINGITTVYFDDVTKARSWLASLTN